MATVTFTAPMPDPFRKADGSLMSNEEWFAQRNDLLDFIVGHEYGGMPPKPEVVRIQKINMGG